jgi:leucyl/phenylalanyl-tRNA--protein transferase
VSRPYRFRLPYVIDPAREPVFPDWLLPDENGLVAVGGDLSERVLLEAYGKGIFPWFNGPPLMWFSPEPRPVIFPAELHISRRLARVLRQGLYQVRFDRDFEQVILRCATVPRRHEGGSWIDGFFFRGYTHLHRRHIAHCVSVYREGQLCGGLYGVSLGRVFFGESMFSLLPNASKVALVHLCRWLSRRQFLMIDCQQSTPHILSLGAVELSRERFLELLRQGLSGPDHRYPWREDTEEG